MVRCMFELSNSIEHFFLSINVIIDDLILQLMKLDCKVLKLTFSEQFCLFSFVTQRKKKRMNDFEQTKTKYNAEVVAF